MAKYIGYFSDLWCQAYVIRSRYHFKRVKLWSLRPHYRVCIDGSEVGILQMIKLVKGGIKQQTPYVFLDINYTYKFNNPYFSTKTVIIGKENNKILTAQRSFLI